MQLQALVRVFSAGIVGLLLSSTTYAGAIVVAPGTSPPGGYVPLSAFGIAPMAGMSDEAIFNFNVPSFTYAGQSWTQVGVVSNGYVVVGGGPSSAVQSNNTILPSAVAPANILAPFWTDLDPGQGGELRIGVLTDGVDSWVVIDWAAVSNKSLGGANSFAVWIGVNTDPSPDEDITFVYGSVTGGNLGLLTVGAQDDSRTVGDTYFINGFGTAPANGTQLRVTTRDLPVSVPEPATLALAALGLAGLGWSRRKRSN